jgi:hypothetical protein
LLPGIDSLIADAPDHRARRRIEKQAELLFDLHTAHFKTRRRK